MDKIVCFTLDLEADYAGMTPCESYESLQNTGAFESMVREYDLKLTTFVTGFILDKNFPVLQRLKNIGSQFESHTYSHLLRERPEAKIEDIQKGIDAYERYFGKRPQGYRAPQGIISTEEVRFLADQGIMYSSSIFPSYLPGRYNCLRFPTQPFIYRQTGLLEIPISVIPMIRLPITVSHINLLTFWPYKALMAILGRPNLLNICMHLYDFVCVPAYASLPLKEKIGYFRIRRLREKLKDFEKMVNCLLSNGYRFAYLGEVAEKILKIEEVTIW